MRTTKGTISTRASKSGTTYVLTYHFEKKRTRVVLRDDSGRPVRTRKEAEAVANSIMNPLRQTTEVKRIKAVRSQLRDALEAAEEAEEASRRRLALSDAWSTFSRIVGKKRSKSGMADYNRRWTRFTTWMAANHPDAANMEDVNRQIAKGFIGSLDDELLSANRRNKILQGCRLIFRTLKDDCAGMANPFADIENVPLTTHGHRDLSEAELLLVCGAAQGELKRLLAIGLYTALRLKDACLLSWENVNLTRGRITVMPAKTKRLKKQLVIPIGDVLRSILEETPRGERIGFVVPTMADRYTRNASNVVGSIRRHFEACGIKTQERHDDQKQASCVVGFHSLRHSFVSICARAGVPLAIVQELCGHGSPAIQQHYLHMNQEASAKAIAALPSINGTVEISPRKRLVAAMENLEDHQVEELLRIISSMEK